MSVAQTRLKEITGARSPEILPAEVLRRDAELFTGITIGHRLNKHGIVFGLDYGFKALGEAMKSPVIKDNSTLIARSISGAGSLLALLMLRGKWTRMVAFGILFENSEYAIDWGAEAVRKAVGGSSPSK